MSHNLSQKMKDQCIDLTKELIKIPSTIKDGNEIYEFTADYLKERGYAPEFQKIDNPHIEYHKFSNLYLRMGNGNGPKILINGHLDTVEAKDNWYHSPFSAYEEDGKIYGLGSCDMKGGCAAAIWSVLAFAEKKEEIFGELFLSLVFGEEAPFSLGTDTLLREHDLSDYDLILVTEPTPPLAINDYCFTHRRVHKAEFPVSIVGAEGRVLFEIEFYGKSAHASHPSQGINALQDAASFINELEQFDLYSNIKMGRGHYSVLNMEGGDPCFTVPSYCKITVNRQLTLGETEESVIKEMNLILNKLDPKSKVRISKRFSPAPELEYRPYLFEDSEMIEKFIDTLPEPDKGNRCRFTTSSVGDFNLFATRTEVPTLVFGPGGENIHAPNEFVYKDDILKTADYLLNFLMEVY